MAYGRPVHTLNDIHLSYEDACTLISRRFFCTKGQHTLGYSALPDMEQPATALNPEKLSEFTDYLSGYLQTFNRKNVAETLSRLEQYLYDSQESSSEIKLFTTDLYLRIKEKISLLYNTLGIPFLPNSTVIDFIGKKIISMKLLPFWRNNLKWL